MGGEDLFGGFLWCLALMLSVGCAMIWRMWDPTITITLFIGTRKPHSIGTSLRDLPALRGQVWCQEDWWGEYNQDDLTLKNKVPDQVGVNSA